MTNVTAIKPSGASKRKAALTGKLLELCKLGVQRDELQIEYEADPLDQIRSCVDRDILATQLNQQTRTLREVETALAKIEKGSYGVCEQCEEPISDRRLDAVPWTRLCTACQSKVEIRIGKHTFGLHAVA